MAAHAGIAWSGRQLRMDVIVGMMPAYSQKVLAILSELTFVVVAIWQFTSIWNEFLFAIVLTSNPKVQPITVALNNLAGSYSVQWNIQMAGALMAALPTLLVYGDRDVRAPRAVAEHLHSAIAGSTLVVLPDTGHVCSIEAPEAFTAAVRTFLRASAP